MCHHTARLDHGPGPKTAVKDEVILFKVKKTLIFDSLTILLYRENKNFDVRDNSSVPTGIELGTTFASIIMPKITDLFPIICYRLDISIIYQ